MSNMIKCDGCDALMYTDSRSERDAYHEFWIDRSYSYHLCKSCYTKFMNDILHRYWNEDECQFVERVNFRQQ